MNPIIILIKIEKAAWNPIFFKSFNKHNYIIYIGINMFESPIITIPVGEDMEKAHTIISVFSIIIKRTRSNKGVLII